MPLPESTNDQSETRRKKTTWSHKKSSSTEADAYCYQPDTNPCTVLAPVNLLLALPEWLKHGSGQLNNSPRENLLVYLA